MEREDIRLECLKLTYTHGRTTAQAVDSAKELEEYIDSKSQSSPVPLASTRKKGGRPKKKADNPDFLS